ncbi:MAG: beta-ketoacyl-ACP synthase [Burkholderiaceae bacterium]|nr:beta-ketoacyl-ACP synthase [Burkholderiaceae bacterium]
MNTLPVFIGEPGIVCALGRGAREVRAQLLAADAPQGLSPTDALMPGCLLTLGFAAADLPDLSDCELALRGRNNRLLRAAYRQIAGQVEAVIARYGAERVAVVLGTSTSGIGEAEHAFSFRRVHGEFPPDFNYAQQEMGMPSRFLAMESGARGPAWTISTACSSSAKALASAARLLRAGIADAVITGGADSLCRFTVAGFSALEAVSPARCNPFSRNRAGINIGEGAALFVMSREPGPVRLSGWGESADAYHMSAPEPSGAGAIAAIAQALQRAQLGPSHIDYLNLHGTATPHNDAMESRAVAAALGCDVPASSTKPLTGHTLGAAGAIEAALCWLTLHGNAPRCLPPHWWDSQADQDLPRLNLITPNTTAPRLRHVLSTSFAFGGSNAALILSVE